MVDKITVTQSSGNVFADSGFDYPEEERLLAQRLREKSPAALDSYKGFSPLIAFDEAARIFHGEVVHLSEVFAFLTKHASEPNQSFVRSLDNLAFKGSE